MVILKRIDKFGSRFYRSTTGWEGPSVTTVLNVIAKPALIPWAARHEREYVTSVAGTVYEQLGETFASAIPAEDFRQELSQALNDPAHKQILKKAGNIGTEVHNLADWFIAGELEKKRNIVPPKLTTPEARRSFSRWRDWRQSVNLTPNNSEEQVVSLLHNYAGTLDLYAEVDGKKCVVDYKTGKRVYEESFLQNCAYRLALHERGYKTEGGWIIRLPKEATDEPFEAIQVPPIDTLIQPWMSALMLFRWVDGNKKERHERTQTNPPR